VLLKAILSLGLAAIRASSCLDSSIKLW
jgi:hypothetical protein